LTTHSYADHLEIWEPQPFGTLWGFVQGLLYVCLK